MGNNIEKINKVNFENIQKIIKNQSPNVILINTLSTSEQSCLIPSTISASEEENIINNLIGNNKIKLVIYGKNSNDPKIKEQYEKLYKLGFKTNQLFIYFGGLFEWLLLQDIYGSDEFPTTSYQLDILKYKSKENTDLFLFN